MNVRIMKKEEIATLITERVKSALTFLLHHLKNPSEFYIWSARKLIHMIYRLDYIGTEHIPETGPAILICNHVSYMDGVVINAGSKRRIRYIIDEPIYNLPIINYFMKLNGGVPIAANRESVARALDMISEGLKNGDVFCIFPEGQITYTGNLTRFRFGIEWMLKRDPVPVVPMALQGLWGSVLSRKDAGKWYRIFPRSFRRKVTLRVGPAVPGDTLTVSHMQRLLMRLMNTNS